MVTIPRVVIAAPASGHGKTSVATGLLGAFRAAGLMVSPHKVGPDYIDPGYHALAAGRPGRNLDPWLVGEDQIVPMFTHGATMPVTADIAVIEGVMGLFDGKSGTAGAGAGATGAGATGTVAGFASTAHVARLLAAPVVLVVDGSGMAASAAALLHGFATFDAAARLGGVIFNKVGTDRHEDILRAAAEAAGIPVLGVIRRQARLTVPSRHLGLIPALELGTDATDAVGALTAVIAASVDLPAVLRLARSAPPLTEAEASDRPVRAGLPAPRIAMAAGRAFTFGYAEHPELLTSAGAEVIPFDPLRDEHLPGDVDGLIIGGGFPEEHAPELSANERLRTEIAALARSGAPVLAECAGLLYLAKSLDGHPMCGVLEIEGRLTGKLTLGYRDAVAATDSPLAPAGARVHGHEFHRTSVTGTARSPAWHWKTSHATVTEGYVADGVHASYLHTHWQGTPGAAARITTAARRRASGRARNSGQDEGP
jgi:cobyrinic acid a,c-diamide synthase